MYRYYRIGRITGRAGSISHVAFESSDNGGRLIFADGYKRVIRESKLSSEGLIDFYNWLIKQIATHHEKDMLPIKVVGEKEDEKRISI